VRLGVFVCGNDNADEEVGAWSQAEERAENTRQIASHVQTSPWIV
jgi:hypothetical protein